MSNILKIGFSASSCIRDILDGKVNINQVSLITAGTFCPEFENWQKTIQQYWDFGYFGKHSLEDALELSRILWQDGKIHQPRVFGAYVIKSPFTWMDLVHTKEDRDSNPALSKAWEEVNLVETVVTGSGLFPTQTKDEEYEF